MTSVTEPSYFPIHAEPNASNISGRTAEEEAAYVKVTRQTAFLKKLFDFMPRAQLAWYEQTADSGLNQERVGESDYQDYRGKLSPAFWDNSKQFYQQSPEADAVVVAQTDLESARGQYDEAAGQYNYATGKGGAIEASLIANGIINNKGEILRNPYKLIPDDLDLGDEAEFSEDVIDKLKDIFSRKSFSVHYDAQGTPRGGFRASGGLGLYDGTAQVYGHTDILDEVPDGATYNAYGNTWAHNMNLYSGAASWNPFKAKAVEYTDFESAEYLAALNNKFMSPLSVLEGELDFDGEKQLTTFAALNAKMLAIQNKSAGFVNPGNVDDKDGDLNWQGAVDPYKDNNIDNFDINANYYTIAMAKDLWKNFSNEEKFTFITHAWEARKRGYTALRDIMGRWFDQPVALTYDNDGEWTEANKSIGDLQKMDDIMRKAYGVTGKMGQWHQDVKSKLKNPIFSVPFNLLAESTHPLALMLDSWGYWGGNKGRVGDAAFEYNKLEFVQQMTLGYARYINGSMPLFNSNSNVTTAATSRGILASMNIARNAAMNAIAAQQSNPGVLGEIAGMLKDYLPSASYELLIPKADGTEEEISVSNLFKIDDEITTVENIDPKEKTDLLEELDDLRDEMSDLWGDWGRYHSNWVDMVMLKYANPIAYGVEGQRLGGFWPWQYKDPIKYWQEKMDDVQGGDIGPLSDQIAEVREELAAHMAQYAAVYNKLRKIYDVSFDMFESLTGINLNTGSFVTLSDLAGIEGVEEGQYALGIQTSLINKGIIDDKGRILRDPNHLGKRDLTFGEKIAKFSDAVIYKLRDIFNTTGGRGANAGTTAVADDEGNYAIYEKLTGDTPFIIGDNVTDKKGTADALVKKLRVVLATLEPLVGMFDPSIDTDYVSKVSPNREQSRKNSAGNVVAGNTLLRVLIDNQGSSEYTGLVKPDGPNYRLEVDFVPHSMQSAQAPIEDSDAEVAIERNVYEQVRTLDGMAAIPGMIQTRAQSRAGLNRVYLQYGLKGRSISDADYDAGSRYRTFENYTDPKNVAQEYVYADRVMNRSDKGTLYKGEGIMGGLFYDPRDPVTTEDSAREYAIRGSNLNIRENIARAWYTYLGRSVLDLAKEYIDNMTVNTVFYDQWLLEQETYKKVMEEQAENKLAEMVAESNRKADQALEAKNRAESIAANKRDAWLSAQKSARKKKEK